MKLENDFQVPVPAPEAWKVLLDVERVAPCVPGATLTGSDGETYKGNVKVKLGPIGLTYSGTVTFVSTDEANGVAVLEATGREMRGNGTAKALVTCRLVPAGDATQVQVETDLAITGKPAQFGRGALTEVAGTLIGQFAANLANELSGSQPSTVTTPSAEAAAATSVTEAPQAALRPAAPAREAEPIDLLAVAPGGNIIKIAAIAVPAFVLGLLFGRLLRRR
jgi:carbon monoxide dehydrogenase subunit G